MTSRRGELKPAWPGSSGIRSPPAFQWLKRRDVEAKDFPLEQQQQPRVDLGPSLCEEKQTLWLHTATPTCSLSRGSNLTQRMPKKVGCQEEELGGLRYEKGAQLCLSTPPSRPFLLPPMLLDPRRALPQGAGTGTLSQPSPSYVPFAMPSQLTLSTRLNHFTQGPDFCLSLAFLLPFCNREKGTHAQHKGEPLCSHICPLDLFNRLTPIAQKSLK